MKLRVLNVVVILVLLALTACTSTPAAQPAPTKPLCVAILMPSTINDLSWSQALYVALQAVQKEMGGESAMVLKYSENMFKVPDAAAALRDYASQGCDIIFGHGSQYGASIQEIAPDFPKTTFAWGAEVDTFGLSNVYAYVPAAEQGGYVNGVMAAMLTKSKIIGVTGPMEVGDAKTYVNGFLQGVASVDPSITVNKTWVNSFSDVALMTEAAKTHIAAGADILTGTAQNAIGSISAVKDAGNVLWFSNEQDQTSLAPQNIVATQLYDWTGMFRQMVENRKSGKLGGERLTMDLKNGGLKIVYNPGFNLPADVKAAAEKAIEGIKSGAITVTP